MNTGYSFRKECYFVLYKIYEDFRIQSCERASWVQLRNVIYKAQYFVCTEDDTLFCGLDLLDLFNQCRNSIVFIINTKSRCLRWNNMEKGWNLMPVVNSEEVLQAVYILILLLHEQWYINFLLIIGINK